MSSRLLFYSLKHYVDDYATAYGFIIYLTILRLRTIVLLLMFTSPVYLQNVYLFDYFHFQDDLLCINMYMYVFYIFNMFTSSFGQFFCFF